MTWWQRIGLAVAVALHGKNALATGATLAALSALSAIASGHVLPLLWCGC